MSEALPELTWIDVDTLASRLAARLSAAAGVAAFDRVVGVARGGLVPAVLVASHMGIKRLETVQIRLYHGTSRLARPECAGSWPAVSGPSGDPARTLFVDEMVDSGTTLAFLQSRYPVASYAALVARRARRMGDAAAGLIPAAAAEGPRPVWVVSSLETDSWILFPWSPPEDRAAGGVA